MKNMMKKLTALTIAMLLLFSLAQVASAEDAIENAPAEVIVATPAPAPQKTAAPATETPATAAPAAEEHTAAPEVTPEATQAPADPTEGPEASEEADPTETPEEEEVEPTEEPTQEPQRSVYVVLRGEPGSFRYGQTVTMEAMMSGFENTSYKITWQYSENGIDEWTAAKGNNSGTVYSFDLNEENCMYYWRVVVDIF